MIAAGMAASGYVAALVAGAGAAFAVMMGVGVLGEIWFWSELVRRWWGGRPQDAPPHHG